MRHAISASYPLDAAPHCLRASPETKDYFPHRRFQIQMEDVEKKRVATHRIDGALRRSGRFDRVFGHEGALPNWVVRPASKRLLDELHSSAHLTDELARETRRKSEMAARLDGMAEAQLCNICLSEPKTHAVLPCLHKCMCAACAAQFESSSSAPRCPICKGTSRGLGRVWE